MSTRNTLLDSRGPSERGDAMITKTSQLLKDALTLLRRNGWTQGRYRNEDDEYCIIGAFGVFISWTPRTVRLMAEGYIQRAASEMFDCDCRVGDPLDGDRPATMTLVHFNDEHATSFTDVEQVFEKAIALAEEDGE